MPRFIKLSADFMRENAFFMGNLTPQQQKIWFVPFLEISNRYDIDELKSCEIIVVPLDEIRSFLQSNQQNKELKRTIVKAFDEYNKFYYKENGVPKMPYKLKKVERGKAYFSLSNTFVFSNFARGRQYYAINLDEIASYQNNKNQKSRTIPLLWYCLSHRHWKKDLNCWEVEFGDKQLKMVLGLDRCDYLYIPNNQRNFYRDAEKFFYDYTNRNGYVDKLLDKYKIDYATLEDRYNEADRTVFFKRWDFEQKVLLPAIQELNKGTMVNFRLQDVLKRSKNKGEKAQTVKSYIGKNYTFYEDGKAVMLSNGLIIDRNITDFTKLQKGKQYKFLIEN